MWSASNSSALWPQAASTLSVQLAEQHVGSLLCAHVLGCRMLICPWGSSLLVINANGLLLATAGVFGM